jgi:hypothetical protein
MLKSFYIRLDLWINTSTIRMSRKIEKSNMLSLDLKGMQPYGGMNCRLTDVAKARRISMVGIEWL